MPGSGAGDSDPVAAASRYELTPGSSRVRIHATSSVHPIDGEATGVRGYVEFSISDGRPDLDAPVAASIELDVADLQSGNPAFDVEMRRRLDARRYPMINGRLTGVEETGTAGRYRVVGDLSFHGAVRPVTAEVDVDLVGDRSLTARWEQVIDIRDFNVKPPRILMFKVDPEVRIQVELVAEASAW